MSESESEEEDDQINQLAKEASERIQLALTLKAAKVNDKQY